MKAARQTSAARRIAAVEPDGDTAEGNEDVSDRICDTLAKAIAEGALKPGVKLSEDVIAGHFGISRTAVRSALGILQREHLIERRRNRGAFVAEPTVAESRNLFEARRALERIILGTVVAHASDADLDRLHGITVEEERIHDGADEAAKLLLSGRFHLELGQLGGNAVLSELLEKVLARLALVMALYQRQPAAHGCGASHHREIIEAVRRRDLAEATRLMDHHLADIESQAQFDESQGDRHSLQSVLEAFSR